MRKKMQKVYVRLNPKELSVLLEGLMWFRNQVIQAGGPNEHEKEWRKPYCRENGTNAKAVSKACRNHGGCFWCLENRLYKYRKKEEAAKQAIKEWLGLPEGEQEVMICRI